MAEIVLFHHALGLTPGVVGFADALRASGHTVHTPDLFEGQTFTTVEEGVGHAQRTGFGEVVARGARAADALPAETVYAGFSLGVLPAQMLAQTRPGARGALLIHGCIPVSEFGTAWPAQVPVQIHAAKDDPFFAEDESAARSLTAEAPDAELFLYPGDAHLFTDSSTLAYDPTATSQLLDRVTVFLGRLG